MPPKKRKRQPTQSQKQSQKVIVNIGSKSAPRKKSGRGRGGLPPPSYQHNLAPTFVTAPQVDYTPLLAMIQHHARPIVEQPPTPTTQTPLSASVQASNAEQMAGEAAIRRDGPTAANFQPPPSQSDERYAREEQFYTDFTDDMREREKLIRASGGGVPQASGRNVQIAVPLEETRGRQAEQLPEATQFEANQTRELLSPQQKQSAERTDLKQTLDQKLKSGEPLTQQEMSRAMLPSTQLSKKLRKRLIDAGYTQFE
jgi:hypothetical protein